MRTESETTTKQSAKHVKENSMNDGSELSELIESNVFEAQRFSTKDAQNVDLARQLKDTFALLRESREMLARFSNFSTHAFTVIECDELIRKIDAFYPPTTGGLEGG